VSSPNKTPLKKQGESYLGQSKKFLRHNFLATNDYYCDFKCREVSLGKTFPYSYELIFNP